MITGIFDSHAHYHDPAFEKDRDALLSALPEKGVCRVLDVATDLESMKEVLHLTRQYPYLYAALGIHPSCAGEGNLEDSLSAIRRLSMTKKVVAIGEIGLDYHYNTPKKPQMDLFRAQMAVAGSLNLPVVIHSREATQDTLSILQSFEKVKGVVHCFSGSAETAEQMLKMGYYLGFTGIVTFPNAKKTVRALEAVPLSRLLVETDCPYLAPAPYRGKRSDSTMLTKTLQKMAEVKGVTVQKMADITRENACRLFRIKE